MPLVWYRPLGHLFLRHIDVASVRHWSGESKGFPQISRLLQVLSPGAPVDVAPGGDLQAKIAYGNHPSSESHTWAVQAKIVQDVVNGCALASKRSSVSDTRGLRVSPLDTVEGMELRIIHGLTFAGDGYRSNVNDDNDFSAASPCEFGHVFGNVCRRVPYLRQRHGVVARVMLCRIDIKDAFHKIPVDPLYAATFGYVFDEYAVVDVFLQFEGRSSPGYWDLVASSLEHAHNQTGFQDAVVSEHGRSAIAHVRWALTLAGRRCRSRQIANACSAPVLSPVALTLVGRRCWFRQITNVCQAPALPLV